MEPGNREGGYSSCAGGIFQNTIRSVPLGTPTFARKPFTPTRRFDTARARRMEEMEREEQIDLAIARLSQMGLTITSVEQGIVTIDLNLACLAEH